MSDTIALFMVMVCGNLFMSDDIIAQSWCNTIYPVKVRGSYKTGYSLLCEHTEVLEQWLLDLLVGLWFLTSQESVLCLQWSIVCKYRSVEWRCEMMF